MATASTQTPSKFQASLETLVAGLSNTTSVALASLMIGGISMTRTEIIAKLKAVDALILAVAQVKQAYAAAVAARKTGLVAGHLFYENVVMALKQVIGATNQAQLAAFGIFPPKPRAVPSAETKAMAKMKAAATRKARGIKGKKERASITTSPQSKLQMVTGVSPAVTSASPASTEPTQTIANPMPATTSTVPSSPGAEASSTVPKT